MISYREHSLSLHKEISETASVSLQTIAKLDKKIKQLSKRLDTLISENPSTISVSERKEEMDLIRKVIDVISVRKVQLAVKCYDFIDQNIKLVDSEVNLLHNQLKNNLSESEYAALSSQEKKRKHSSMSAQLMSEANEPKYCSCQKGFFGDMILCDNDECPVEWYHYACVGLMKKPRNSWLCPSCISGAKKRPNVF